MRGELVDGSLRLTADIAIRGIVITGVGDRAILRRSGSTLCRRLRCEKVALRAVGCQRSAISGQRAAISHNRCGLNGEIGSLNRGRGACSVVVMPDALSHQYEDLLTGSYDCVDRIVLNAYHRLAHRAPGFRVWWRRLTGSDDTLDNTNLMRRAG